MLKPKFDLFGSPGTHNTALKVGQNNLFVQKMDSAHIFRHPKRIQFVERKYFYQVLAKMLPF